ncbi:MAG: hypothetical protein UEK73_00350 [Acetatifactor sp.]|nr:hypothetical protein [Acetatifactor sp.]
MKEKKRMRKGRTIVAFLLALLFAVSAPAQEVRAEEYNENTTHTFIVASETQEYDSFGVQPVTTLVNCQIIMAFRADEGLCMTFTTSCAGDAKVIGVKDIKVQQKVWYGWKTVFISDGAESYDSAIFGADLVYPDAIKDKTYRVICTHYADVDGYEEAVNDTGAFKYTY